MTHIAIALFFSLVFIGAGIAAQAIIRAYWIEIRAALRGEMAVRRAEPAYSRITVTVRPQPGFAPAGRRAAA